MDRYSVRDLWQHRDLGAYDIPFTAEVQSHEAKVYPHPQLATSANGPEPAREHGPVGPRCTPGSLHALEHDAAVGSLGLRSPAWPGEHGLPETLELRRLGADDDPAGRRRAAHEAAPLMRVDAAQSPLGPRDRAARRRRPAAGCSMPCESARPT
jgi:hypothetical protein